jgi:uncharacterized protein
MTSALHATHGSLEIIALHNAATRTYIRLIQESRKAVRTNQSGE